MSKTQSKRTDPTYQAQDILSRRDHSVAEVRAKLKRKGFTAEQVETAILWLQEKRLLNDAVFARRYIASTLQAKAVGRRWLAHKLKAKGVAASVIEEALAEFVTPEQEKALAQRAAAVWQRVHPQQAGDKQRLVRHLLRRGFSWEIITLIASA